MGGRVGEDGGIEWDANVPLDEQIQYYQANPPSSFNALKLTSSALADYPFDGHGEPINSIFDVACVCGGRNFVAYAHDRDDEWRDDPISLKCASCGRESRVFDARKDGYDGALGHNTYIEPRTTDRVELTDVELGAPPYRLVVRFEHLSDVLGGDFSEWKGRESDLYSWFTLVAISRSGEVAATLFERECA